MTCVFSISIGQGEPWRFLDQCSTNVLLHYYIYYWDLLGVAHLIIWHPAGFGEHAATS